MKIIVRNKGTSQYVKETNYYTLSLDEAVDFLSEELAIEFCDKHKLKEHEILRVSDESD